MCAHCSANSNISFAIAIDCEACCLDLKAAFAVRQLWPLLRCLVGLMWILTLTTTCRFRRNMWHGIQSHVKVWGVRSNSSFGTDTDTTLTAYLLLSSGLKFVSIAARHSILMKFVLCEAGGFALSWVKWLHLLRSPPALHAVTLRPISERAEPRQQASVVQQVTRKKSFFVESERET